MATAPISKNPQIVPKIESSESYNWIRAVAGGALIAGGCLLLGGKRKAGLALSVTGAALALVEQPETLGTWWQAMPAYLAGADKLINEVHGAVGNLGTQREKLRQVFGASASSQS